MTIKHRSAFYAYPGGVIDLTTTIESAAQSIKTSDTKLSLSIWPQLEIFGQNIPDEVREAIAVHDVLVADITIPNPNVYYEIGFAIGRGKPVAPVVNLSFADASLNVQREGLFDNIGYKTYENSDGLVRLLQNLPTASLLDLYGRAVNFQQPLYILDTYRKTDYRNWIFSAIKASKVFFRSFDPAESPRLSTVSVLIEASSSAGIVVPLLATHIDDAARHNLRGAFLAGLGHGLDRETLILQTSASEKSPADYRDFIKVVKSEVDIAEAVGAFAKAAILAAQSIGRRPTQSKKSDLQLLSLGASAAENEFRTLEEYFVETAEFMRALRGEVRVIAGRKGSGKTAIFFRIRDSFRKDKECVVTDLKPESHQLSLFREELLKTVDVGLFDHTLAAFWYFLVLSEILLTIKKDLTHRSRTDSRLLDAVNDVDALLEKYNILESGDFTTRLNRFGTHMIQEIDAAKKRDAALTPDQITNLIFRNAVGAIRKLIHGVLPRATKIVFLFDNIDKSWPATGVNKFDVRLVRIFVETLDKVRRDFQTSGFEFMSIVFLRNDIYELLVDETPDRGKAGEIRIDWTDRAKLRQVIYRRLQASINSTEGFEEIWGRFFVAQVQGRSAFEFLVDHCLMRPRFLIHIVENALANAINRGHSKVEEDDCLEAVRQHSFYLADDFGYEIRDVSGLSAEILYAFSGATQFLTKQEILSRFERIKIPENQLEQAWRLMLWYGVLGVASESGATKFIYDYEYNMKRLEADIRNAEPDVLYVLNDALYVALRKI